jgi:aminoglycoside phosphotransferase (APT) family kinase protein
MLAFDQNGRIAAPAFLRQEISRGVVAIAATETDPVSRHPSSRQRNGSRNVGVTRGPSESLNTLDEAALGHIKVAAPVSMNDRTQMPVANSATIERVRAAFDKAGFPHDRHALQFDTREDRCAVRVSPDRMAWFPLNEQGRTSLSKERRILRLLEKYCHFPAPRMLHEDDTGWDIRALVQGAVQPSGLRERLVGDPAFAHSFGTELGRMLAEQHTLIPPAELAGWLPTTPNWPRPEDLPHLAEVIDDPVLLARIDQALRRRTESRQALQDPVLAHADLGLHNVVVDPVSYRVVGLFDYEGAVFGDRHHDFAYMVFPSAAEPMLEGALSTYEPATGIRIDRDRVHLLNAVAAVGFLAFRHGHLPEEAWCGRTLAQDLTWTGAALRRVGL